MTALPGAMQGIDPIDYLNFVARLQNQQQRAAQQPTAANNQQFQLLLKLLGDSQGAYNEARGANEQRRNEIMDRDVDTRNRLLDYVSQFGQSMLDDVNRMDRTTRGRDTANLAAAGFLGGSPDMMRGAMLTADRARSENLNKVKDTLLNNAINVDERASNRLSDFQERIQDPYPDPNAGIGLAAQLGALIPGGTGGGGPVGAIGGAVGNRKMRAGGLGGIGGGIGSVPSIPRRNAPKPMVLKDDRMLRPEMITPHGPTPAPQQTPWNSGNPYANYEGQVKQYVPDGNGGMMNARQSMPALGIYGAGVQMGNGSGGGGGYIPSPYGSVPSGRTPLWYRDPVFERVLAQQGLNPRQQFAGGAVSPYQIAGAPSSTGPANGGGGAPGGSQLAGGIMGSLLPLLNLLGLAP